MFDISSSDINPMTRLIILDLWNSKKVGIDFIRYSLASILFVSTFILYIFIFKKNFCDIFFNDGYTERHGAHHSAQKYINTSLLMSAIDLFNASLVISDTILFINDP
jgi:hypothetical protein